MALGMEAGPALATPVQPDIRKLLLESPPPPAQYAPARAGWQGPEAPTTQASLDPVLASVSGPARAQEAKDSLKRAAIPDPRALAAIVLVCRLQQSTTGRPSRPIAMPSPPDREQLLAA
jgi:hypothetical protein